MRALSLFIAVLLSGCSAAISPLAVPRGAELPLASGAAKPHAVPVYVVVNPPAQSKFVDVYADTGDAHAFPVRYNSRTLVKNTALAWDGAGRVYVGQGNAYPATSTLVDVYDPWVRTVSRSFTIGVPLFAFACDAQSDMYAIVNDNAGHADLWYYAPGSSSPQWSTVVGPASGIYALAIAPAGAVYVASYSAGATTYTIYPSRSQTPSATISTSTQKSQIAFDQQSNAYVTIAQSSGGAVGVYAPGSGTLSYTFAQGTTVPQAVAADVPSGMAFVGYGNGNVIAYRLGSTSPSYTIPAPSGQTSSTDSLNVDPFGRLVAAYRYKGATENVVIYQPGSVTAFNSQTFNYPAPLVHIGPQR